MTDRQKLNKCISVLKTLRKDVEMALIGKWDFTYSEGFEAQLELIENILFVLLEKKENI